MSRAIMGLVGLVPLCIVSSWVFCGSKIIFYGYFVVPKFFLVGIWWVRNIFSWVFCGSQIFSRGYFAGGRFFLVGILWAKNFFSWVQNFISWVNWDIEFLLMLWHNQKRHYGNIQWRGYLILDLFVLHNMQTLQTCRRFTQGHFVFNGKWLDKFYIVFGPVLVLN